MYLCTKFQRSKIQIIAYILFSFKKHKFIIAVLIAALPFFGFATNADSLTVKAAANPIAQAEAHTVATNENAPSKEEKLKEEIREHINHHVLDAHHFTLFSDSETGKSVGFP